MVEFPSQMISLPPVIKQAGCPLRMTLNSIRNKQAGMILNLILNFPKDMSMP
jgi:hypothetical protein